MATGDGFFNEALIQELRVSKEYLEHEIEKERAKAAEREALYARYTPRLSMHNQTAILVDDGIATGATMLAVIKAVRKEHPHRVVIATPVGASSVIQLLKGIADEVVCLEVEDLRSISMSYDIFSQVEDRDVVALLKTFRL